MSSSGCSLGDRFGKHFKKCRNREGHVKASVFLPDNSPITNYIFDPQNAPLNTRGGEKLLGNDIIYHHSYRK